MEVEGMNSIFVGFGKAFQLLAMVGGLLLQGSLQASVVTLELVNVSLLGLDGLLFLVVINGLFLQGSL
jgi:hypothetical protein